MISYALELAVHRRLSDLKDITGITNMAVYLRLNTGQTSVKPSQEIAEILVGDLTPQVHEVRVVDFIGNADKTYTWEEFKDFLLKDPNVEQALTEYLLGVNN